MKFRACLFSALAIWLLLTCRAAAIGVEELDPTREWRVEKIEISGNQRFPDSQLIAEMVTQARPWYRFWEERPLFDPVTFATDLDRLRRFYQSEGYYKSRITHDIDPDEMRGLVSPHIYIEENSPVVIS
jgi:outer membrane protein assembly factor BamA